MEPFQPTTTVLNWALMCCIAPQKIVSKFEPMSIFQELHQHPKLQITEVKKHPNALWFDTFGPHVHDLQKFGVAQGNPVWTLNLKSNSQNLKCYSTSCNTK